MWVCDWVCMYVYWCVCMCMHVYVYGHVGRYVCVYVSICVYVYVCGCVCRCMGMFVCMYMCMCVYVYRVPYCCSASNGVHAEIYTQTYLRVQGATWKVLVVESSSLHRGLGSVGRVGRLR